MPESRRLFFAVWPSADAVAGLQEAAESLKAESPDWLRWQPPERWHVTVLFVGACTPRQAGDAAAAGAERARSVTAEPLSITGFGRFGAVLWAGVAGGEWLEPLHRDLRRRLRPRGERQRFRAHVTIARARGQRLSGSMAAALGPYDGPAWTPDELTLVASTTGPHPRYDVLERFPFARARG